MRLILVLGLFPLSVLAACEAYTDATSPCFGADGEPAVGRSAATPPAFTAPEPASKDCAFEPIGAGR